MLNKKILFVVDKPDWAYEFMVKSWLPYLMNDYDCYVIYQQDYLITPSANKSVFYKQLYNVFTSVKEILENKESTKRMKGNFFYKKNKINPIYKYTNIQGDKEKLAVSVLKFDVKIEMAFYFQYAAEYPFTADKNIVGIFTDAFPHEGPTFDIKNNLNRNLLNREEFFIKYLKPYDHIIVGGGNLYNDYHNLTDKVSFVYGIYGEEFFQENLNVGENEWLTIGWTGNPDREMKGFKEIIEPAIENIKSTGRNVRLKTKFSGTYDELYTFYKDVDLVVIASSADSGPSLYAEACLSGVPVISTKVGLPLLGIIENENGYFIERSISSVENSIKDLYDNREILRNFSKRIKIDYLHKLGNNKSVQNLLKILK